MPANGWLEKAISTHKIHVANLKNQGKDWTLQKTAKALNRSLGSVCEDIMIAKWYKTHSSKLERLNSAREALEFIREKKDEMDLEDA